MNLLIVTVVGSILGSSAGLAAVSQFSPDQVRTSEPRKSSSYLSHGIFVGGDRDINEVTVKSIRHSKNKDFERIVIDLEGNRMGDPVGVPRPPYYQVAVNPELQRLVVTLFGKMKLEFDPSGAAKIGKKSNSIQSVSLFPMLETDRWSFSLNLNKSKPVEVFELSSPTRIIIDLKNESAQRGNKKRSR